MKRFTFRLQRLMDILLKQLEQKRIEMAAIQHELDLKNLEIQTQQKAIHAHEHNLTQKMLNSSLPPADYVLWENFIDYQYVLQNDMIKSRKVIEKRLHKARDEYIEIDRNRKMLENLKDKQYQRYMAEFERIERAFMDEIGNRKYFENLNGGEPTWLTKSGKT